MMCLVPTCNCTSCDRHEQSCFRFHLQTTKDNWRLRHILCQSSATKTIHRQRQSITLVGVEFERRRFVLLHHFKRPFALLQSVGPRSCRSHQALWTASIVSSGLALSTVHLIFLCWNDDVVHLPLSWRCTLATTSMSRTSGATRHTVVPHHHSTFPDHTFVSPLLDMVLAAKDC